MKWGDSLFDGSDGNSVDIRELRGSVVLLIRCVAGHAPVRVGQKQSPRAGPWCAPQSRQRQPQPQPYRSTSHAAVATCWLGGVLTALGVS